MTDSSRFPVALLEQSNHAKLHYFKDITVPHQHLRTALNQLLLNLEEPADISILFIVGPTGVGKTTLRLRAQQMLLEAAWPELLDHPERVPVAGIEAVAPEQGKFSHRDYYVRVLEAIGEVLAAHKSSFSRYDSTTPIRTRDSSAALRRSLENVLRHRQVKALMVDEAHHLLMTVGAHQMLQQMTWIKSIANLTQTTHALFGTYELLNCCRLSGQLSRRSEDIHLQRYLPKRQTDVTEFIKVVQTFERHLPLPQESKLDQFYEYLLDFSIGCIGILKTWLLRALRNALLDDAQTLTLKHLQQCECSASRRRQLHEEAEAGERRLEADHSQSISKDAVADTQLSQPQQRQVGKRNPKRDPVGGTTIGAT